MLTWLFRWLKRDDRELFAYWDGQKRRRIDPLVAWRRLMGDQECNFTSDFKIAMNPAKKDGTAFYSDAMVDEAEQKILRLTRSTFGVEEWSEGKPGLTVTETIDLLGEFLRYRIELKKKRSTSPILSPSSDTREPPGPSDTDPDEYPPNTEPDLSSTKSELAAAEPTG